MEHWWIGLQISKIKQHELLQEAARFRLLLNAGGRAERSATKPCRPAGLLRSRLVTLRFNLGQQLIDWGTVLRDHRVLGYKQH
jgi:hypothetical protein